MKDAVNRPPIQIFPPTKNLSLAYTLSLLVALLLIIASVIGLIMPSTLYPSDEARQSFLTNDVINLVVGLPILLASIWFTRKRSLVGLLLWPGALLYIFYNYIVNLLGVPFGWITPIYLALVFLCISLIGFLLVKIDVHGLKDRLTGSVPTRISGWFLIIFGVLFLYRGIDLIIKAGTELPLPELGLLIADMVLSAVWITGGILLLKRHPIGYASGLGLLISASMLFIGLIIFLILNPFLTEMPFVLSDFIVIVVMSFICFIPSLLYLRGVVKSE